MDISAVLPVNVSIHSAANADKQPTAIVKELGLVLLGDPVEHKHLDITAYIATQLPAVSTISVKPESVLT